MKIATALLIASSVSAAEVTEKKASSSRCRALAMSGGGSKGAFEAGALWGMLGTIKDKTEMQYDVVTGVSAGSINTLGVSVFPKGQEQAMIEELSYRWSHLAKSDLKKNWFPFGPITGLLEKTGIYNTAPLYDYIKGFMKDHNNLFYRKWVLSSVDVGNGNYVKYEENTSDPVKAAVSSSSIPFIFNNQVWPNGEIVMDGGTVWNTNLVSAINKCRESGFDDANIDIDVIVCTALGTFESWDVEDKKTINNMLRAKDIKETRSSITDIYDAMHAFPKVNYRYYVEPSEKLPDGINLINPENDITWPMQLVGRKDGAASINLGPGVSFRQKIKDRKEKMDATMSSPEHPAEFIQA